LGKGCITIPGESTFRNEVGGTLNLVGLDGFTGAIHFNVSD
jgi:hypothetical protein